MKRFAYILSFSICLTAQAQKLWTVDECMQYAVMHNHEVRLQSIGLDDYKEEKVRAKGNLRFAKASSAQIWCSVATALAISALGKPIT